MMLRIRTLSLLVAVAAVTGACDRTPVDPVTGGAEVAALLGPDIGVAPPLSLPSLVQAAIFEVHRTHGGDAARAMVGELRRLQDLAAATNGASTRETFRAGRQSVTDEQLGIVLRVFGDDVVASIIMAIRHDADTFRARLDAIEGRVIVMAAAQDRLARSRELLVDADAALASGAIRMALSAATDAAAQLDAARAASADALRIPGLDDLFDTAARLARARGGEEILVRHRRLQEAAQTQVRVGTREDAQAALAALRAEEIAVVMRVLGTGSADQLLERTRAARLGVDRDLESARQTGRDVLRLERMLASTTDLLERADAALERGDPATALDLGGHAAGLINAIRTALGPG